MAKKALIVLKDAGKAGMLKEQLESNGYKTIHHRSPFEAVHELYSNSLTGILLGLDVFDRASRSQLLSPELWALNRETPVVVLSAEDPVDLKAFFDAGPMWLKGVVAPGKDPGWVARAISLLRGTSGVTPTVGVDRQLPGSTSRASEPPPAPRPEAPRQRPPTPRSEPEHAIPMRPKADTRKVAPDPVAQAAPARAAAAVPGMMSIDEKRRIESKLLLLDEGDFYRVLDVQAQSSTRQVKAAYFRLVKAFHPDRYFGRLDEEWGRLVTRLFRGITRAYETLIDPKTRERYDQTYKPAVGIVTEPVVETAEEEVEVEVIVEARPTYGQYDRPESEELTRSELDEFLRREQEWMRDREHQASSKAQALYNQTLSVLEHPDPSSLPLGPIREAYKLITEAAALSPEDDLYVRAHEILRELYETKRAYYHFRRGQERLENGELGGAYQDLKDAVLFDPRTEYLLALVQAMLEHGWDTGRAEILTQSLVDEEPDNPQYRILYGRALAAEGHLREGLAHLHLAARLGMRSEAFRWIQHYERAVLHPES